MQDFIDNTLTLLDSPLFARVILVLFSLHTGLFAGVMLGEAKTQKRKACDPT